MVFNGYYEENCVVYEKLQNKFDRLLTELSVGIITDYMKRHKKIMPFRVANLLAYSVIQNLIQKKWLDENLDFIK